MSDRRRFVKFSLLSSAALLAGKNLFAKTDNGERKYDTVKDEPVVISTWDFGKAANVGAWNILKKGGRALDAVEAGVMIPEADPEYL